MLQGGKKGFAKRWTVVKSVNQTVLGCCVGYRSGVRHGGGGVFCVAHLVFFYFDGAIVETFNDGQRFHVYAEFSEFIAAMLKFLFNEESHSNDFSFCLFGQIDDTFGSVAIGQEVVDEENLVALFQIIAADTYAVGALLGEGIDRGGEHIR